MPLLEDNTQLEQEEEVQPGQQPQSGAGTTVGAGTGATPQSQRGSGNWTNLQSYIKANQPQTERMTGQIQQNLEQARTGVGEQIKQSKTAYEDYLREGIGKTEEQQSWLDRISGGYTPGQDEIDQKAASGWFTPEKTKEWESPNKAVEDYEAKMKATATEQGRLNELKRLQGQQATRGEGLLNQMLMQNDPASKQMFEQQRGNQDIQKQYTAAQDDVLQGQNELSIAQEGAFGEGAYAPIERRLEAQNALNAVDSQYGQALRDSNAITDDIVYRFFTEGASSGISLEQKNEAIRQNNVLKNQYYSLMDAAINKYSDVTTPSKKTGEKIDPVRQKALQQLMGYTPQGV